MKAYDDLINRARARADQLIGERALAHDKLAKARRAAIGAAYERVLEALPAAERVRLFAALGVQATAREAKLLASHPLNTAVPAVAE